MYISDCQVVVFLVASLPVVPPLLDLVCRLAVDEGSAAERADGVVAGRPVDAVPLPGLGPHDEYGDAGDEAA